MWSSEVRAKGLKAVDEHYAALTQRYGFPIAVPEEVLFNMAYRKKQQKALDEAVEIFQVLLDRYTASWRGHFFLGEAYREKGDTERAVEQYKKTLEIRPDMERAKQRLEELKTRKRG